MSHVEQPMGFGTGEKLAFEEVEKKALTQQPLSQLSPFERLSRRGRLPNILHLLLLEPLTFKASVSDGGSLIPELPVISRHGSHVC